MRYISEANAINLINRGGKLFDLRSPSVYRYGTWHDATNLSIRQIGSLLSYPKTTPLIFFGDDRDVETTISYAMEMGFINTYAIKLPL